MKIAGIISEYDPLHAGHIYHMEETRRRTGCDYIVAVMDGWMSQRGEISFMDKFLRVRMALTAGADAVFELPPCYSLRPAQMFARGGVDILNALGADFLSFGCETDDLNEVMKAAKGLLSETYEQKQTLHKLLSEGMSYPRARAMAMGCEENPYFDKPNFMLGAEYLRRIVELHSPMEPVIVKRTQEYHASSGEPLSASLTRALLREGKADEVLETLPETLRPLYLEGLDGGIPDPARADAHVLTVLRSMDAAPAAYPDDSEGLSSRILKLSREAGSIAELIDLTKCRRYTRARIARLIWNMVLGVPGVPEKPYLRLLGMRKDASNLLKELDIRSGGRIVSNPAMIADDPVFKAEERAANLWGLLTTKPSYRKAGRERTEKFIVL